MTMLVVLLLVINKINHKERKDEGNMECSDKERERETVLLKSRHIVQHSIYIINAHNFFYFTSYDIIFTNVHKVYI